MNAEHKPLSTEQKLQVAVLAPLIYQYGRSSVEKLDPDLSKSQRALLYKIQVLLNGWPEPPSGLF